MLALALLAAVTAIFYQHQTTRQAMAYWGTLQAIVIRDAPDVMFCRLSRDLSDGDTAATGPQWIEGEVVTEPEHDGEVAIGKPRDSAFPEEISGAGGERWRVSGCRSIVHLAGLSHLRHALLQDESYHELEPTDQSPLEPTHALIFSGNDRQVVILLNLDRAWVRDATQSQWRSLAPIAPFLQRLLEPLDADPTLPPSSRSKEDPPRLDSGEGGTGH